MCPSSYGGAATESVTIELEAMTCCYSDDGSFFEFDTGVLTRDLLFHPHRLTQHDTANICVSDALLAC